MGIFEETDDGDRETKDDIGVSDLADEFQNLYDEIEGDDDDDGDGFELDPDELFGEVEETAEQETIDTLDHIFSDSCDNERCQDIREQLGIDNDDGGEESGDDDDDPESTEGGDDDGGESDDDGGSGDGDGDDDTDPGDGDDDGSDSGNGEPWDEDTNIFGESV